MNSDGESKPLLESENSCKCSLLDCYCGVIVRHEWTWDATLVSPKLKLFKHNLAVKFNPGYSNGTAAVRGSRIMSNGRHHYWEVKILTPLYGTDVMVGVGTLKADVVANSYCSLLGRDCESWGFSYKGYVHHAGERREYSSGFVKDNIVGIHLDTWKGTLQFFVNRKPLGTAFSGLRGLQLYPMACSTAAESNMRITYSCSVPASLQMDCLGILKPVERAYLHAAFPSLRYLFKSVFADILQRPCNEDDEEDDEEFFQKFTIFDDFDFALVGCRKKRKRIRLDETPAITLWPTAALKLDSLNI